MATYVCDGLEDNAVHSFVFLNPHSVVLAEHDAELKKTLTRSSGIFCDGVGLELASLILNRRRIHRVYGYEFFIALSSELDRRRQGRVFFLGGTEESVDLLKKKYISEFPGIPQVNSYAPPFKPEFADQEIVELARLIRATGSDIVWVGLGSPKQEKMLHRILQNCDVRCIAAIGAVFDFYSDRVPHTPTFLRRLGLQWIHRLILEPKRLWRRTFISAPVFIFYVLKELMNVNKRERSSQD